MKHDFYGKTLEFWNHQAKLKLAAGSKDIIAKQLEIEAIAKHIQDGMNILEVGCGNGITAIELVRRFDIKLTGIDFSEEMINEATAYAKENKLKGIAEFKVADIRQVSQFSQKYDLIFTERVLINLPDWPTQKEAIINITNLLAPGGLYVMCENSQEGLDMINQLRNQVGLPSISPPWHNRYFRDSEIAELNIEGITLKEVIFYSSTYYFLSRVVNAALSAKEGKEPAYDAPINQMAIQLPSIGDMGQGRIWLWQRK